MSYVLQLWASPANQALPSTIDAALTEIAGLQSGQSGSRPIFTQLAAKLKQRYPDLDSAEPEEGEDEIDFDQIAWSDSPLTGKTQSVVWGLGLNIAMLEQVRPFVIREANALGLCVMDGQAGEVFLPDGKILGQAVAPTARPGTPAKTQATDTGEPPKNKEVLPIVFERLTPLMAEYGYKAYKGKRLFKRVFPEGWCEIDVFSTANYWPLHAVFELGVQLRCHAISDLVSKIAYPEDTPEQAAEMVTLFVHSDKWIGEADAYKIFNGSYCVKRLDELDLMLPDLIEKLRTVVFPALEHCQTLQEFEHQLNPPQGHQSIFSCDQWEPAKEKIIGAYLVGNPLLLSLCERFAQIPQANIGRQRCLDYVGSHPLTQV